MPNRSPFLVRAINTVGSGLRAIGMELPHLNEARFLREACRKTGLSDFGDNGFREGLGVLLRSLQEEAQLTTMGRLLANQQIVALLVNRLQLVEFRKRHPDVAQQEIIKPIFIVGLPRTGTTILQALLAQDPASRSPLSWETAFPCPPRAGADRRIAESRQQMEMLCKLIPGFEAIHPVGAELPQECISITAHEFASIQFELNFDIPSYRKWYMAKDLVPVYRKHKEFLQHLNYTQPGQHWVLKTPAHLGAIDAILAVYPDACIIQTHRDPNQVLPSTASLYFALRFLCSDRADPVAVGREMVNYWSAQMERGIAAREALPQHAAQFYDLHFPELMKDPFGAIEKIYTHFGLTLTPEAKKAMQDFLANNAREKHGKHHYTAAMYGMDEGMINQAFGNYCNYFHIGRSTL
jgi:hypothetical protein